MHSENKICLSCNKSIRGRADKKFCDDHCRSAYHNCRHGQSNNYIRSINHALLRNRRILEELLPQTLTTTRTMRTQLYLRGFHFNYFTHTHTSKKGKVYYFCYDHGYLPLTQDKLVIIREPALLL